MVTICCHADRITNLKNEGTFCLTVVTFIQLKTSESKTAPQNSSGSLITDVTVYGAFMSRGTKLVSPSRWQYRLNLNYGFEANQNI